MEATAYEEGGKALPKAQEATAVAGQAQSGFLAHVGHEMRTPLQSIISLTALLLNTEMTREQRDYLTLISSSADLLLATANDVADFSDLQAGYLQLDESAFDLFQVVERAVGDLAFQAHQKGLELICHILPGTPMALVGDPARLHQVLVSLTSEAVKFADHGEVLVRVETQADLGKVVELHFAVSDTGTAAAQRRDGGPGLGLSIVQPLVALMGGRVWTEDQPGKGSAFHFTIRLKKETGVARLPGSPGAAQGDAERPGPIALCEASLCILFVEDNASIQWAGKKILEQAGHSVELAGNGLEAIQKLEQDHFDLILMDVEMPQMDGLEATRLIREREAASGRHVPILAMTAYATRADQDKCLQAGMDGCLLKPFTPEKLTQVLERFRPEASTGMSAPHLDLEVGLQAVGGNEEFLREAVQVFLEQDLPRHLAQLRDGLSRGDARAVRAAAHGLKGTLGSFGGIAACNLAQRLEALARQGDLGAAQSLLQELVTEIQSFAACFERPVLG
jgi:CheY-like chemotaxis protein